MQHKHFMHIQTANSFMLQLLSQWNQKLCLWQVSKTDNSGEEAMGTTTSLQGEGTEEGKESVWWGRKGERKAGRKELTKQEH